MFTCPLARVETFQTILCADAPNMHLPEVNFHSFAVEARKALLSLVESFDRCGRFRIRAPKSIKKKASTNILLMWKIYRRKADGKKEKAGKAVCIFRSTVNPVISHVCVCELDRFSALNGTLSVKPNVNYLFFSSCFLIERLALNFPERSKSLKKIPRQIESWKEKARTVTDWACFV